MFVLGFLKDAAKLCPDCGGRDVEQRFTGFGGVMGFGSASPSCLDGGRCNPRLFAALRLQLSGLARDPCGPLRVWLVGASRHGPA